MDAINYKNGQKNNWRRQAWNKLRDARSDPRNDLILYLPGATDLDRPEAIRRGFREANMIAIERDEIVAKHLRSRGTTTINADIFEVMKSWPETHPVGIVVADMQCGMTDLVSKMIRSWIMNRAFSSGTILVNCQRGRDKGGALDRTKNFRVRSGETLSEIFLQRGKIDSEASRAALIAAAIYGHATSYALDRLKIPHGAEPETLGEPLNNFIRQNFLAYKMEWLPSYRSSPRSPYFDSLIATCRGETMRCKGLRDDESKETRRMITAALAIRTMRLRGELPSRCSA